MLNRISCAGVEANDLMLKHSNEIVYSLSECNYRKFKSKPFGWKYGLNKQVKSAGRNIVKQYACDFYGNKELIKSFVHFDKRKIDELAGHNRGFLYRETIYKVK